MKQHLKHFAEQWTTEELEKAAKDFHDFNGTSVMDTSNLTRDQLIDYTVSSAVNAGLDVANAVQAGCTGHENECGKWGANCTWIPCSPTKTGV